MTDERSILRREAGPIGIDSEKSPQSVWRFVRFRERFSPTSNLGARKRAIKIEN